MQYLGAFDNLDNMSLGMGLTKKPRQVIDKQYAALDGWGETTDNKPKKYLGILSILFIIFIAYKILSK